MYLVFIERFLISSRTYLAYVIRLYDPIRDTTEIVNLWLLMQSVIRLRVRTATRATRQSVGHLYSPMLGTLGFDNRDVPACSCSLDVPYRLCSDL